MFAKILGWLLKLVDVSVTLNGDLLHLKIDLGNTTVLDLEIDLIKDRTLKSGDKDYRSARVNVKEM